MLFRQFQGESTVKQGRKATISSWQMDILILSLCIMINNTLLSPHKACMPGSQGLYKIHSTDIPYKAVLVPSTTFFEKWEIEMYRIANAIKMNSCWNCRICHHLPLKASITALWEPVNICQKPGWEEGEGGGKQNDQPN